MVSNIQAALSTIVQNAQAQLKEVLPSVVFAKISQNDIDEFQQAFQKALGTVEDSVVPNDIVEKVANELTLENATADDANYLLEDPWASRAFKPNVREFMDATQVDFRTAAELLSTASTGAGDYRDWQKIMASSDPTSAARQATGQFYNSDLDYVLPGYETSIIRDERILAQTQNFAVYKKPASDDVDLIITAGNGLRLEVLPGDATAIRTAVEKYGYNLNEISDLAKTMESLDADFTVEMREAVKG